MVRFIKTKRNVTKMIIFTSLIFLIGNAIIPFVVMCILLFDLNLKGYLLGFSLFSNTLLFFSYGLNMFVCYSFNNKYRREMKKFIWNK